MVHGSCLKAHASSIKRKASSIQQTSNIIYKALRLRSDQAIRLSYTKQLASRYWKAQVIFQVFKFSWEDFFSTEECVWFGHLSHWRKNVQKLVPSPFSFCVGSAISPIFLKRLGITSRCFQMQHSTGSRWNCKFRHKWANGIPSCMAAALASARIMDISIASDMTRFIEFIVSPKKVVGCRGGHRNVEGGGFFWKSERFKNLIVRKYQDSTPIKFSLKVSTLFQNNSWHNRIYLRFKILWDFQIPKIYQDPPQSLKTLGDTNCFGPTRFPLKQIKQIHMFDVRWCRKFWKFWISGMLRSEEIICV